MEYKAVASVRTHPGEGHQPEGRRGHMDICTQGKYELEGKPSQSKENQEKDYSSLPWTDITKDSWKHAGEAVMCHLHFFLPTLGATMWSRVASVPKEQRDVGTGTSGPKLTEAKERAAMDPLP